MTQFEFEQLSVIAGAWDITASTKPEPEARIYRRCAAELRDHLRHADTSPGVEIDGEPAVLPDMTHPRPLPTIEEA